MMGFLSYIDTNCGFLTSISVKRPDHWARTISYPQPLQEVLLCDVQVMMTLMRKLGNSITSPSGPSLHAHKAFLGSKILVNLPALKKSFTIVVSHNEEIYNPAVMSIASILTLNDRAYLVGFQPASNPSEHSCFFVYPSFNRRL